MALLLLFVVMLIVVLVVLLLLLLILLLLLLLLLLPQLWLTSGGRGGRTSQGPPERGLCPWIEPLWLGAVAPIFCTWCVAAGRPL